MQCAKPYRSIPSFMNGKVVPGCSMNAILERKGTSGETIEKAIDLGHQFDNYFMYRDNVFRNALVHDLMRDPDRTTSIRLRIAIGERRAETATAKRSLAMWNPKTGVLPLRDCSNGGIHQMGICLCDPETTMSFTLSGNTVNVDRIPASIGRLRNLVMLNFGLTKTSKIENLDTLDQLQNLVLASNHIKKIEGLDMLSRLRHLHLGSNEIEKIENLDHLHSLEDLVLSNNRIKKIENLDGLENLTTIWIDQNKVSKTSCGEFRRDHQGLTVNCGD